MSKFLDILECCKDGGECKCKKGEKCDSPNCKCKSKKECSGLYKDRSVKEAKDDDEKGDWKFHNKKDADLDKDKACSKCGSTKGYIKTKDGVKCNSCGKLVESKFEAYLQIV